MSYWTKHALALLSLVFLFTCPARAQVMSIPSSSFGNIGTAGVSGAPVTLDALSSEQMTNNLWYLNGRQGEHSPLDTPAGSVSMLDLKAPGKARREFSKGYQLLMRKDFTNAIGHLTAAISLYPGYVAAHNALGSAYLGLSKNELARDQFTKSIALDDHVPTSFLNLGCAQLALQDYRAAEESVQKASSLAPVDLVVATALTYAQFMNRDYEAVLATSRQVHGRKHRGAAMVHYFAAAAWDGQNRLEEAQSELLTFLQEDPSSPQAEQARQLLAQIKVEEIRRESRKKQLSTPPSASPSSAIPMLPDTSPTPEQVAAQAQLALQDSREQNQIAEAEAASESNCPACATLLSPGRIAAAPPHADQNPAPSRNTPFTLRTVVDEVAVFFAATDHGKSVTDLTRDDVGIRDDQKSPAVITDFRNQAELPLRLGIVIDTSESIASRFSFEQKAATDFLQKVLTGKNDQAFVVGVANSVLLVQDFTGDQEQMSHAINRLAPSGGTALWDAVAFAADKLAARAEDQPVARILVVISDGKDNSSSASLKEAIANAERGEVFVYTVSTREANEGDDLTLASNRSVGDRALKMLANNTGGAAFVPGSLRSLNKGLDDLQEVIRSRYLISYKPASFKHDGQFRAIDISAQKSGRKLRVYARKGYYASAASPNEPRDSRE